MKKVTFLFLAILFVGNLFSQDTKRAKTMEAVIKTSAQCGDCKERIEGKLNYTKGIIFAELNDETKNLTVKFKTKNISLEEIKKIISEIGYDADEVKANPQAQSELPKCCQPGGMKK